MGTITKRKQNDKTYYVYQETYRVKIDDKSKINKGKNRGSGKSKVCTKAIYLGSADDIVKKMKANEPQKISIREFGLCAAAYQVASEIGLQDILSKHIKGETAGIPRWIYFFVTIINRLYNSTSKNKMSDWLKKTILPELLSFDPKKLNSKNFWYASNEVMSEEDIDNNLLEGIGESIFSNIEDELFKNIDKIMNLSTQTICYDTTNFYTYIQEPSKSKFAKFCHSKDSKSSLKHIGLLMAVEKEHGIPITNKIYQANRHDSKLFSNVLSDLVISIKKLCNKDSDFVLVMDKGNNSKENFNKMNENVISWIGSLQVSHHKDLKQLPLSEYNNYKETKFYRTNKNIFGIDCTIIITFNKDTQKKQEYTFLRNINKLKETIEKKISSYKKIHTIIPKGIIDTITKSEYKKYLSVSIEDGILHINENIKEIEDKKLSFGKNILFSNLLNADSSYIIDAYREKNIIEEDFQLLKNIDTIRFRPIRHWTDSKIISYAFCCITAMKLMRIMQWKLKQIGYTMSPKLLVEELEDIQEVIMIYNTKAIRKIKDLSSIQEKLFQSFSLQKISDIVLH